ncbi:MAG TPA: hypothetical protein VFR76_13640 [Verrucomicrobiae bacterium]|nr:hypothetical protein [Verrucomicrobiae bacterium]
MKLRLAVISVLVVVGATTPRLLQRQSEIKLREEILSLQTKLDQLSQQRTEDERPSNLLAQAGGPLPDDKSLELLRLRSEVGSLRRQTNELFRLQAENRQLQSDQASGRTQRQPSLAAGDSVPVESFAFAGYATPEAAFESTLSAHVKNDLKTFFEGFTPERRQEEEKGVAGKSEDELAAQAAKHAAHFAGADARILKSRLLSEDEAELVVFLGAKENELVNFTMKRIGGEWKISRERH